MRRSHGWTQLTKGSRRANFGAGVSDKSDGDGTSDVDEGDRATHLVGPAIGLLKLAG